MRKIDAIMQPTLNTFYFYKNNCMYNETKFITSHSIKTNKYNEKKE